MERVKSKRKRPHRHHFGDLGIYLFLSRHGKDFRAETMRDDFHKLCGVVSGSGHLEGAGDPQPVGPNQLVYLPAGTPHRLADDPADPLTIVVVCFYESVFGNCTTAVEALSLFREDFPAMTPFRLPDNYARLQAKNRLKAMFIEQMERKGGSRSMLLSQLIDLLVFAARTYAEHRALEAADAESEAFAGTLHFIEDNFYRPIKVEELAALANMSYRSYTEQFKARTGKTVTQYLAERRVEYAKRLMLETGDILFASFEAGFGDLTYFYRVFKKLNGSTPKQFIARHKPRSQNFQAA
jgi:AraC-like DNA-binding protein